MNMEEAAPRFLDCLRCEVPLTFAGTKYFHEGSRAWDIIGFKNHQALDAYFCPRCGRAEFFVAGVGEDPRGQGLHDDGVDDDAVPLSLAVLDPGTDEDDDHVDEGEDVEVVADEDVDADNLPEWDCASCGEAVPGNFEVCWNCSAPRP
jgi:hypothetical protein